MATLTHLALNTVTREEIATRFHCEKAEGDSSKAQEFGKTLEKNLDILKAEVGVRLPSPTLYPDHRVYKSMSFACRNC